MKHIHSIPPFRLTQQHPGRSSNLQFNAIKGTSRVSGYGYLLRLETAKSQNQNETDGGIERDSHTQAEVHRNQVADQEGIQGQAYREGIPEVGSPVGVLTSWEGLNRTLQEGLTKKLSETAPIRFSS